MQPGLRWGLDTQSALVITFPLINGITPGCFFLLSHVLGPQDAERNGEGISLTPWSMHMCVCVCVCVCVHSSKIHFTAMRPLPFIMLLIKLCWAWDHLQILLMFWGNGSRLGSSSLAFLLTTNFQGTSIALSHSCTLRSKAAEYFKTDQQILFYTQILYFTDHEISIFPTVQ